MVSQQNNALTTIMNNLNTTHPQTENKIANSAFPSKTGDAYASLAPRNDPANGIWANAIGLWEDADSRRGLDGYKLDTHGVMLGYGRTLGSFVLGASVGYLGGDYKDKAMNWNDSDLGSYSINLYASYRHCSGFFGTVIGGYAYTDYDMRYGDGTDRFAEDFHADSWYAQGRLGYAFLPMANFSIAPSVGIGYARTETSAHDLRVQGVGNTISYSRHKIDGAFLPVSLDMTYAQPLCSGGILLMTANGGYTYNFDTDGAKGTMLLNSLINSSAYAIAGRGGSRSVWNVGGGVKYVAERWEAGAKYDYQRERAADAHSVQAHVSFKF